MKTAVCIVILAFIAVVAAQTCHYDCYAVTPASSGADAKTALLKACNVTDYKVDTNSNSLQSTFKKSTPANCTVAVCAKFANAAAISSYRNDCEHPKPQYQVLNGKGADRYDAPCTTCQG